ncbi:MAG: M43 family zinc metalloprotease [Bacteroidota bacterium]
MKDLVKSAVIIIISICFGKLSFGQGTCGTEVNEEQLEFMSTIDAISKNRSNTRFGAQVNVPIKFFILRRTDGTGGADPARVAQLLNEVNEIYAPANMTFEQISSPSFVNNDEFFDLSTSEEESLASSRDVSGVINIYISGNLESGTLCGYTRFPPSSDRIFLNQACIDEVGTTAHELGHYFTLFHTHGKTNNGTTDELVSGINCDILGDNVCDTPADPNLTGLVNGACSYTGDRRDREGNLFNPNPTNLMSYAPNRCRNFFSQGQYERIRNGFENGRDYLNFSFEEFNVKFNADVRTGCGPLEVQFFDNTVGGATREWQFNGASIESSFSSNPIVTYSNPGIYNVGLSVTNTSGQTVELIRTEYINVSDPAATVDQNGVSESFGSADLPATWPILNPDQTLTFERSDVSFDGNQGSLFINNYDYDAEVLPQVDEIELTNLRLEEISTVRIRFNYAYTTRTDPDAQIGRIRYDTLEIGYRLECDDDFTSIFKRGGDELASASSQEGFFIPTTAEEWSSLEVSFNKEDIPGFANSDIFNPVIRNISDNGNNLYIDNLELIPEFDLDSLEFFRTLNVAPENISLRWFNPAINELGVVVQRSFDGINFEDIVQLGKDSNEFDDTTVPVGTPMVYYRAATFNSREQSSYTPIISVPLIITSIDDNLADLDDLEFKVYPNPSPSGIFNISMPHEIYEGIDFVQVFDSQSRSIQRWNSNDIEYNRADESFRLNFENVPSGALYVLIFSKENNEPVRAIRLLK